MALLLQVAQSSAKKHSRIQVLALRSLTVIFRDLVNFSRDSLNSVLRPTWKFLNATLPAFTEQACYRAKPTVEQEIGSDSSSDEDELPSSTSIEALAYHSLELLATLV